MFGALVQTKLQFTGEYCHLLFQTAKVFFFLSHLPFNTKTIQYSQAGILSGSNSCFCSVSNSTAGWDTEQLLFSFMPFHDTLRVTEVLSCL